MDGISNVRFPPSARAFHTGAHNLNMSRLFHWSEAALPKTHVQLIDQAGPWALAKADPGTAWRPLAGVTSGGASA